MVAQVATFQLDVNPHLSGWETEEVLNRRAMNSGTADFGDSTVDEAEGRDPTKSTVLKSSARYSRHVCR